MANPAKQPNLLIPDAWRGPEDVLRPVLRKLGMATAANRIFSRHPAARITTERFAWLITDRVIHPFPPADDVPLLHLCLARAMEWAVVTMEQPDAELGDDLIAWLAGLFQHAPALDHVVVVSPRGAWQPLVDPPLPEWARRNPGARLMDPRDPKRPQRDPYTPVVAFRAELVRRCMLGPELAAVGRYFQQIINPKPVPVTT